MNPFRRSSSRLGREPQPETPYQRAAQAWDDRIGSARQQAHSWRLMAFGATALLSLSVVDRRTHAKAHHFEQGRASDVVLLELDRLIQTIEQRAIGNQLEMTILQDDGQFRNIFPTDCSQPGPRVLRWERYEKPFFPKRLLHECLAFKLRRRRYDHEVDGALVELSAQVLGNCLDEAQVDLGVHGGKV